MSRRSSITKNASFPAWNSALPSPSNRPCPLLCKTRLIGRTYITPGVVNPIAGSPTSDHKKRRYFHSSRPLLNPRTTYSHRICPFTTCSLTDSKLIIQKHTTPATIMSRPIAGSVPWWKQRLGFEEEAVWEAFVADFRRWQYVYPQSPYFLANSMFSHEARFWIAKVQKLNKKLSTLSFPGLVC